MTETYANCLVSITCQTTSCTACNPSEIPAVVVESCVFHHRFLPERLFLSSFVAFFAFHSPASQRASTTLARVHPVKTFYRPALEERTPWTLLLAPVRLTNIVAFAHFVFVACTLPCTWCSGSTTTCTQCQPGYYLTGTTCTGLRFHCCWLVLCFVFCGNGSPAVQCARTLQPTARLVPTCWSPARAAQTLRTLRLALVRASALLLLSVARSSDCAVSQRVLARVHAVLHHRRRARNVLLAIISQAQRAHVRPRSSWSVHDCRVPVCAHSSGNCASGSNILVTCPGGAGTMDTSSCTRALLLAWDFEMSVALSVCESLCSMLVYNHNLHIVYCQLLQIWLNVHSCVMC